jgi:hypothetical protein
MKLLTEFVPDLDVLLQLPPEEVGFLIVKSIAGESQVHPTHFASTTGAAAAYQMPGRGHGSSARASSSVW